MASVARLSSSAGTGQPDHRSVTRRKEGRPRAASSVTIATTGEGALPCRLSDISPHGCNLELDSSRFRIGQIVSIDLSGGRGVTGIVRWLDARHIGIEFFRSISNALVTRHAD